MWEKTMTKEALKMALEALESSRIFVMSREVIKRPEGADWYDSRITAIKEALAEPEKDNTYVYASSLATAIWHKHYMKDSPKWKPLDTTEGVLTQIDNMTCGLVKEKTVQPEQEPVAWRYRMPVEDGHWVWNYATYVDDPKDQRCEPLYTTPPQLKEPEPVDFEALIADIECIDCRYRGDPSYDHDAYWMRDKVIAEIKRHASFYTSPPQRKPLTDEEIKMMIPDGQEWKYGVGFSEAIEFARAIEAAHNIKE